MNMLGNFVVRYHKLIIIIYLLLLVPAIAGYLATRINYDLVSYMPDELNSKQGEQLLEEEFGLSGLGLLAVRGKSNWELKQLIGRIELTSGVEDVVWLGAYTDIYKPLQFIEPEIRDRFISSSNTDTVLLQVQFTENARSKTTNEAVELINRIIDGDEDILFGGEPAIISEMQATIDREIFYYSAVAVAIILIILTISNSFYLSPFLFLISMGVAVVINMGTNFIQGEISFMTASIAAVMQLGISLDYAIFLMHRFEEEKEKHATAGGAMAAAVSKTAGTIASSALTTIGGFAALMVMQNGIGRDMGLVLAKGIVISLVVTLTFLPGLILAVYPFSSRYRHRILLPTFKSASRWVTKARWAFPVLFIIILVPSYLGQERVEYYYSNRHYLPEKSISVAATNAIMDEFGAVDLVYVITPDKGRVREIQLNEEIACLPHVESIVAISEMIDPAIPELIIPREVLDEFMGGDYRYSLVFLRPFNHEQQAFEAVDSIRRVAENHHEQYYVTGASALTRDMAALVSSDARNVALFSLALICLIVAFSLHSISLPLIMVLAIQTAIWINLAILYYQGQPVSSLTPIMISAIQLGATVDYAILFTMRYRENTMLFFRRIDAIRQTIEDTGRPILTSALTLFSATIGISFIAEIRATGEITMLIGRGAIISMLVIFTLLPSLLLLFEKVIRHTTRNWAPAPLAERPVRQERKQLRRRSVQ
jgi:uncharacterized protein